jgi:uncharacterized RDD family membrane protein YckC
MSQEKLGVVYRKADYPGLFARMAIDAIDFAAVIGVAAASLLTVFSGVEEDATMGRLFLLFLLLGFGYIGPWKATGLPTLGYLLFKVRLVNVHGERVNFWQASGRALFMVAGPVNYLFDSLWIYSEAPRQTLRDKFSGTYLVKKGALEEYRGKVVRKVLHVMGYRTQVEEIRRT